RRQHDVAGALLGGQTAGTGDGRVDERRIRVVGLAVLTISEGGAPVAGAVLTTVAGVLPAVVGRGRVLATGVGRGVTTGVGGVLAAGVSGGLGVVGRCPAAVVIVAATGGEHQAQRARERGGSAESGHPVPSIEFVHGVVIVSSPSVWSVRVRRLVR